MKSRGKKQPGGPAPSKKQQLARQRLSTHDPQRARRQRRAATAKLKKGLKKLQPAGLEDAVEQMALDSASPRQAHLPLRGAHAHCPCSGHAACRQESQPEQEARAASAPAGDAAPASTQGAARASQEQQKPRPKKKKGKKRKASQLERIAMDVAQSQVRRWLRVTTCQTRTRYRVAPPVPTNHPAAQAAEDASKARSQALAAEHKQKLQQKLQERTKRTKLMRKTTRSGQPVMSVRLDRILSQLEQDAQQ